jgi:hypothetical protein
MAIPNINQLTAELRMMPDQALQRMAMMYKQDPYILPMVISEDMARKKMRAAAQAQMAQPQPKVADQAIMSMGTPPQAAPGIAALPAPNMQSMADGGIAGYAEGGVADSAEDSFSRGGMFDFTQRSEPVVRMADGGVARYQAGGQPTGISEKGRAVGVTPYGGVYGGERLLPTTTGYEGMSITEFLNAAYNDVSDAVKSLYDKIPKESLAQVVAEDLAKKKSQEAAERPAAGGARSAGVGGARAGEREAYEAQLAGAPAPSAAPSGGTRSYAVPTGGATASSTGAAARAAVPSVEAAKKTAAEFLDSQAIEKRITDYQKAEADAVEAARERRRKALEGQGKAYEGLESLIKKEEEGAKGELEQSKAMAILNAGLAMMAGTSPRALENIGKGAMVGTGQYAEAIKDFKKSAKERQRAMADIEQARRAEARADTESQLKFEERAAEHLGNARKYGVEAFTSLGIKNADMARQIYTTEVEQKGAMERARMQVNAPPAQLQLLTSLGRALGAKDPETALKLGWEAQTRETRIPALYENYVKLANSQKISLTGKGTEGEEFMRKYPTFETYLRGMSVQPGVTAGGTGGGFVQPPEGASILR